MKICIIGTGYVGLVTGACFAAKGNDVWCLDNNAAVIDLLNSGELPIYEPGLQELVRKNIRDGRLHFSTDMSSIENALFCFITVGTPPGNGGGADLSQVSAAAREIGLYINQYTVVVNKSTVPIGTAGKVCEIIREELRKRGRGEIDFAVVSNPEFLKEGCAVEDFLHPDRVVIGTANDGRAAELMRGLYRPFVCSQDQILLMDTTSAEITKYAANAMLATRISLINEIAGLCDKVGGDVQSVRLGIGTDERIGLRFLQAGVGYGGSCFSKDLKELVRAGYRSGVDLEIIQAVERVNNRQKSYLADMVKQVFGSELSGRKFAVWGLAFKPQTDDMREAPAVRIVASLVQSGAIVAVYDPQAAKNAKEIFQDIAGAISYADEMMSALDGADALLLVTEWQQFRCPDFAAIKRRLRQPVIFDGRNQYDPKRMEEMGFRYFCIGRGRCGK